jgi:hypothetical protein
MRFGTMSIALAILAASPAVANAGRYEPIPNRMFGNHPPTGWHQPM